MENKKMPFAVFVLKYVENMIEDYKKSGYDEIEVLDDIISNCSHCPLCDKCSHSWGVCRENIKKYVESAE